MLLLELLPSSALPQNFVFEIAWTFVLVLVITNSYMH
jgi:hypothetical protein